MRYDPEQPEVVSMLIDFLKLVRVASLPALAAVVAAAPSQALEWQKEVVFEGSAKPSLALGADGLPRVAFLLESMPGFVAFAERRDSGWVAEQVATGYFYGPLDVELGAPPLPEEETRLSFLRRYAEDSGKRLEALRAKDESWWEAEVDFFEVRRSRAWVMVRRIAHSSHHRGQQMAMLRMLGRDLHSNYGPTADTGGLMQNEAKVIYAYPEVGSLLEGEAAGGRKAPLPGPGAKPPTERPSQDELG